MKYGLGSLLLAGGLVLSFGTAYADVLMLTSPAIADNGTLAIKNACSDKQRSPNCVGENISPPLAWSGIPAARPDPRRAGGRAQGSRQGLGWARHPLQAPIAAITLFANDRCEWSDMARYSPPGRSPRCSRYQRALRSTEFATCATVMSLQGHHRGALEIGTERSSNAAPARIVLPTAGVAARTQTA
jgi:hypothetical protein